MYSSLPETIHTCLTLFKWGRVVSSDSRRGRGRGACFLKCLSLIFYWLAGTSLTSHTFIFLFGDIKRIATKDGHEEEEGISTQLSQL